ncbi:MAG TPA: hypothetical protein DD381_03155 [Lentisphaeria bacterium]|nr:MAG: hypothetical protein A2X47_03095 [Lentisphaerae bacterium GWF2_38_69]HBM15331.1 hypothetical protein [Lentisphaeria bacterium]
MTMFRYRVADKNGKTVEVSIDAENAAESLKRLRARGLNPLENLGEGASGERTGLFRKKTSFNIYQFIDRLVPLLKAHIQLERAFGIMADGTEDKGQKEIIQNLRRGLHEGKKLSELVRAKPEYFPSICANLIEAGEESGALIEVMIELKHFLDYKKETSEFMVTSSIYPAIIIFVTVVVIILLFTVFVPRFTKIFFDMGKALPLPTQIMVWISNIMTGFWWLWLSLIAAISFSIIKVRRNEKGRVWWDKKMLTLPLIGGIITVMEIGRFIKTLAVLIKNNVHLISTVNIASKILENKELKISLSAVNADLKGGKKLSKALSKSAYVPKIVLQMLEVGEESGNMGGMLADVAEQLEKDMKLKIKRLLALFEPACILFLAVVVLAVVISIFLAIMEMNNV